jgi:hypothetical protein
MRHNGHARYYDKLTPEERFRLDVLAMARGDVEESELLTRTCPRHNYTMNDVRFAGRWNGAIELGLVALMDLRPTVAKLRMIEVSRVIGPYLRSAWENDVYRAYFGAHESGSRYAWSQAGKDGDPPGYEGEDYLREENADPRMDEDLEKLEASLGSSDALIAERLVDMERDLAAGALAGWRAFEGFCEEDMGLDVKKLLAATFGPALEDVEYFEEACERLEAEADPAAVEECREALGRHWRRLLARG